MVSSSNKPYLLIDEEDGGHGDSLRETPSREDETRKDSTISGNTSLSLQSGKTCVTQSDERYAIYNVEFNRDTKVALELNLVHTSIRSDSPTFTTSLSMDGKYLATLSRTGIVQIFDVKTGKNLG